jgi:hypothetical protein
MRVAFLLCLTFGLLAGTVLPAFSGEDQIAREMGWENFLLFLSIAPVILLALYHGVR